MPSILGRLAVVAVVLLAGLFIGLPGAQVRAAPLAQREDGLDGPLLAANMCGAGSAAETHFTLAATGDTFPHENIQAVGEAQGYDALFDYVRPFLKAADIAYTNFDGAMLEGSPYTGYPAFNYNPQLATALKNAGIGLVSTANNHIMDRGPEGLDATLGVLQQAGILQHGAVPSTAADQPGPAYLPITLTRNGVSIRLGFLSFTWGTNGIPDPYHQVNLLWQSDSYGQQGGIRQEVLDAIAQARRETDLVIVAAHWGYEYHFYPDPFQIEGARQMAAAGADVILGAQSHTLQPVDILDTAGRKTLVIYSLANFLASQGAFQDQYFSASSLILYVGIARRADGTARVTGYRYLPTIHVDNDTRPAPIPTEGYEGAIEHIRLEMRDIGGLRQLGADPMALTGPVEVCPPFELPGTPPPTIGGDFAQFFATLGDGMMPRAPEEALAVFGAPLGPPVEELAGDCATITSVLYTERQRLELHPTADWPFRVAGTQIGVAAYRQRYGVEPQRRTNLDGDAIVDQSFRAFFKAYGGLSVFGYPISGALQEQDANKQLRTVQYFERARFELATDVPPDAPLMAHVQLGALGREYAGIASQCGIASTRIQESTGPSQAALAGAGLAPGQLLPATPLAQARDWSGWPLVVLILLLAAGLAFLDWRRREADHRRRYQVARRRRAERRVGSRPAEMPTPMPPQDTDDQLLRRLLESDSDRQRG